MSKLWTHKWLVLSLFLAVFAGKALLTSHHFYVHDDIQIFRLNQFIECFRHGQIPCRWAYDLGKGYGEPWFNYYPPLIYALPSLIHLLGFSLIASLNLFMFATFLLAAWGMYLLVSELTKSAPLAALGSALFTFYPFHATNVFLRGVYAENLAWSLTPLLLYYLTRQLHSGRYSKVLPFLFAAVFLTHIISSFIVIGIAFFWILALLLSEKSTHFIPAFLRLLGQIIAAICLAAFFFIPALVEKNLVQTSSMIQGYYAYYNHFVSLRQLFLDYTWNYGASYWGTPPEEMGYMVGHIHTILLAISIGLALFFRSWRKLILPLLTLILFFIFLFLTHSQSSFVWQLIPPLAYLQFPWRLVGWAAIPLVFATTLLLSLLPKKISIVVTLLSLGILLVYSAPFFAPRALDTYVDADYLTGQFGKAQQTSALFDYLPATVHQVPESYAQDSLLPTPIFYFPGWVANEVIHIDPDSGLILDTPAGLRWTETPLRLWCDLLTLVSLICYGIYLVKSHVQ